MSERPKHYKKCPVCGARNDEFEAICANCFVDISSIGVKCDGTAIYPHAQAAPAGQDNSAENGSDIVICPKCRTANPDYSELCDNCGEDISSGALRRENSDTLDKAGKAAAKPALKITTARPRLFLFSREEKIAVELSDGMIFGRCDKCADQNERERSNCVARAVKRNFIDCSKFDTVSRSHARIIFEGGDYYIIALPESKNMTRLNNVKLLRGNKYKLSHGDTLDFSKKLKLKVFIK